MTGKKKTGPAQPKHPQPRNRWTRLALGLGFLAALLLIELALNASALDRLWPFGGEDAHNQSVTNANAPLAAFFTPEVRYWQAKIIAWAKEYRLNPNVIAIVIQIESCGNPAAVSGAGALGLMQVMPFHFANGENMLNPDTNVRRGIGVFYDCLTNYGNPRDVGLALACYNGGPGVIQSSPAAWAAETQFYYSWATGLWNEVVSASKESETLTAWQAAGGTLLCDQASRVLYPPTPQSADQAGG